MCEKRSWSREGSWLIWLFDNWAYRLTLFFVWPYCSFMFVFYLKFLSLKQASIVSWFNASQYERRVSLLFLLLQEKGTILFLLKKCSGFFSSPPPLMLTALYCLPPTAYWLSPVLCLVEGLVLSFSLWMLWCGKCLRVCACVHMCLLSCVGEGGVYRKTPRPQLPHRAAKEHYVLKLT